MSTLKTLVAGLLVSLGAAGANAATIYSHDFNSVGEIESPGSLSTSFLAPAGAATLNVELAGYSSLDGADNGYTDVFHLALNGSEIFTGTFNLGGGGTNAVLFNPNGGSALTTTFGASDDIHNSTQVTWSGGMTQITLPVALTGGSNTLGFSYTGGAQGLGDEGWGIDKVSVIAAPVPEPETYALMLAGLAAVGAVVRRRKRA